MAAAAKPSHDVFGLGLGLLSWIFPNVSVWIKLAVSILIIGLILYLRMSKDKREQALNAVSDYSDKALTNFIVPVIGGAFRGLFFSLIGIVIADYVLNIRLIHHENIPVMNSSANSGGIVKLFLHTLGNLNSAGTTVVILACFIGAWAKVDEARNERNRFIFTRGLNLEYTTADFKGTSSFLWVKSMNFEFSYNGKTYRHKEYDLRKRTDPQRRKYFIQFSASNPNIAKILWDQAEKV